MTFLSKPKMSARSNTLYVEGMTIRRLLLTLKLYPQKARIDSESMAMREKTADELGNEILNDAMREKYPRVFELERLLRKAEQDFIGQTTKQEGKKQ